MDLRVVTEGVYTSTLYLRLNSEVSAFSADYDRTELPQRCSEARKKNYIIDSNAYFFPNSYAFLFTSCTLAGTLESIVSIRSCSSSAFV